LELTVQRRINLSDLQFGQPLAEDLVNAGGLVILRRGETLLDNGQIERLLQTGLYLGTASPNSPSVLRQLNDLDRQLERLFTALSQKSEVEGELRRIAQHLIAAVELNRDIALACILLNQIGGTYSVRHCIETAIIAWLVAQALGKPSDEQVRIVAACLSMNVGMMRHQDQMQNQRASLSQEEAQLVRSHPEQGVELLKHAGVEDAEWLQYVLAHHECEDGSGYPEGKTAEQIPQNAKIIALADRYCAWVSARNYRKSLLPDRALQEAFVNHPSMINPELAQVFIDQLGPYPPGSYVRLKNGEIGVVSQRPREGQAHLVHVLIDAKGVPLLPYPIAREADGPLFQIKEGLHEDEAAIRFGMKQVWGQQAAL
jgi:HD-GYP domain-containing protein (c-di-GMP phosphodiesterase class II)